MSKRGTENQLTKDNYDQEDQDTGPQMGAFKMATSDELARRPMKALRRLGSRTLSNLSDDGKRPSPTSSQSSVPNLPSSSSPSLPPATSYANPFANVSFGTTPAKTGRFSTSEVSHAGSQSRSDSTGKPATRQMGRLARTITTSSTTTTTTTAKSNTAPVVSLSNSILAKGAFTFNIGSNANALAITTPKPAPVEPLTIDREGYERSLRGVNQGFLKRIQRDLEHNATANLAGAFEAYIEHRKKVKKQYPGIEEPQTIVLPPSSGTDTSDVIPPKKSFSGFGVNTPSGDTTTASVPAPPTSSPFVNLAGSGLLGFGSSSIKGAVGPPKNPTSAAAWNNSNNLGMNGSMILPSSLLASSSSQFTSAFSAATAAAAAAAAGAGGSSSTTNSNTPFAPLPSPTSNASSSSTTSKPFLFSPKPFAFTRQGSISSGTPGSGSSTTTAKPFVFQTSSQDSQWTPAIANSTAPSSSSLSSSQNSVQQGDQSERVVGETKSELVDSRKGEEDERTVYEVRAKLFGTENNEFQDLGVGQFRVNEHNITKKRRMIMRTSGTGLITLNSWIIPRMTPQRNKTTLTIFAVENGKPKKFVLRVKEENSAQELLNILEASQSAASA